MSSSSSSIVIKSCLDILRRTDPRSTEEHLNNLVQLVPNDAIVEELFQRVDVPLRSAKDKEANDRLFLLCDHNRDGDCHRSPWSNAYTPPLEDGFRPSERLRKLELYANEVFDVYRELYYGKSSVSSVYLWDKDDENVVEVTSLSSSTSGFAGCFLIRKSVDESAGSTNAVGYWNSIHVIDVSIVKPGKCQCKLTTTVLLSLTPTNGIKEACTSGSLIRQNTREFSYMEDGDGTQIIINVGKLIEEVEIEMRSELDSLYIQKTRHVVEKIYCDSVTNTEGKNHTKMLNQAVLAMAMTQKLKPSAKK